MSFIMLLIYTIGSLVTVFMVDYYLDIRDFYEADHPYRALIRYSVFCLSFICAMLLEVNQKLNDFSKRH